MQDANRRHLFTTTDDDHDMSNAGALRLNQEWVEESPNRFRSTSGLIHMCQYDTCTFDYKELDQRICAISGRALEPQASKRTRQ